MTHYVPIMKEEKALCFFVVNSLTGYEAMVSVETAESMKEIEDLSKSRKRPVRTSEQVNRN